MSNKKQTSIEWLIERLRQLAHNDKHHLGMGDIRITQGMLDDFYEQAKEMHKQEIIDAWEDGYVNDWDDSCGWDEYTSEEYYQKTFKSKQP
jgi:hypothetical protein